MIFRALNAAGDWTFGRGKSGYAIDEAAIELELLTRIKSWKGNCFYNYDAGVDWSARVDKNQEENLVNELRALIVQTYGIVAVNSLSIVRDAGTRGVRVEFNVDTIYSPGFTGAVAIAAGAGFSQ